MWWFLTNAPDYILAGKYLSLCWLPNVFHLAVCKDLPNEI